MQYQADRDNKDSGRDFNKNKAENLKITVRLQ